jgi:hypothetical protein
MIAVRVGMGTARNDRSSLVRDAGWLDGATRLLDGYRGRHSRVLCPLALLGVVPVHEAPVAVADAFALPAVPHITLAWDNFENPSQAVGGYYPVVELHNQTC